MSTKGVRGANVCILKQTSFCIHHVQALTQTNVCFEALAVSMHIVHTQNTRVWSRKKMFVPACGLSNLCQKFAQHTTRQGQVLLSKVAGIRHT